MRTLLLLVVLLSGCATAPAVSVNKQALICQKHVYNVVGALQVWCAAVQRPNRWPPAIYEIKCSEPIYDGWNQNPIYHAEGWHEVDTAWRNFAYKLRDKRMLNTRYPGLQIKTQTSTQFCDVVY